MELPSVQEAEAAALLQPMRRERAIVHNRITEGTSAQFTNQSSPDAAAPGSDQPVAVALGEFERRALTGALDPAEKHASRRDRQRLGALFHCGRVQGPNARTPLEALRRLCVQGGAAQDEGRNGSHDPDMCGQHARDCIVRSVGQRAMRLYWRT